MLRTHYQETPLILFSPLMLPSDVELDDQAVVGTCKHCDAEVPYDSWIEVSGEPGRMACPCCRLSCLVDDVFPPL